MEPIDRAIPLAYATAIQELEQLVSVLKQRMLLEATPTDESKPQWYLDRAQWQVGLVTDNFDIRVYIRRRESNG